MEVIPAIMPKSYEDMRQKMAKVLESAKIVQIDLMDGVFVPERTFPFLGGDETILNQIMDQEEGLPYWDMLEVELDLMVQNAHKNFDLYVSLGPKRIIFHIEAEGDKSEFIEFLEGIDPYLKENIEFGVAISNDTPIEEIFPFIPHVSFVQCMGIENIGYQGEEFDERVLDRIKILKEKYPDLMISVDGSVNIDTINALKDAGAQRFVAGSAIFDSFSPNEEVNRLEEIVS